VITRSRPRQLLGPLALAGSGGRVENRPALKK
jgi:hypothetical protein